MAKGDFIDSIVREARQGRAAGECDCLNCRLADALEECAKVVGETDDLLIRAFARERERIISWLRRNGEVRGAVIAAIENGDHVVRAESVNLCSHIPQHSANECDCPPQTPTVVSRRTHALLDDDNNVVSLDDVRANHRYDAAKESRFGIYVEDGCVMARINGDLSMRMTPQIAREWARIVNEATDHIESGGS